MPSPHVPLPAASPATPPAPELDTALVWFRRDLRAHDHAALHHALAQARRVHAVFVFDTDILDGLPRADRRVEFIRDSVAELDAELRALGAPSAAASGAHPAGRVGRTGLVVRHGRAVDEIPRLARALHAQAVYANHDFEPAARERDATVRGRLSEAGIALHTSKDHVIFEADEVLTGAGTPFSVFTPYKTAWLKRWAELAPPPYTMDGARERLAPLPPDLASGETVPTLAALGFEPTNLHALRILPGTSGARETLADFLDRIDDYHRTRDFPAVKGPSYLSVHLRFGTLSIRELAHLAAQRAQGGSRGAEVWLSELIWREFYMQILHHHPRVVGHAFKPAFDKLRWEHGKTADAHFQAWCEGRTGYPLVDAAMHQIKQTGYMHNRLRMVVASFLVKDLGLDWRRGEAYFATHLNDFDLAANNGGWQWAASTGCDAQPWFRIFNPVTQSEKFDPQGKFIRRYLPQLAKLPDKLIHAPWKAKPADLAAAGLVLGRDYPEPVVQHEVARGKTLERFKGVR